VEAAPYSLRHLVCPFCEAFREASTQPRFVFMNNRFLALLTALNVLHQVCLIAAGTNVSTNAIANASTNALPPGSANTMESLDAERKLNPGDRISYRVIEDQDQPISLTITDSGDVEVPYYGLVPASGKTCQGLATEIKTRLEKRLYRKATVIIAVEQVDRMRVIGKVFVTGQVKTPGGYDIISGERMTVSKAILSAGGFSDFSDKKHVRLARKTPGGDKIYTINVLKIWEDGRLVDDLTIQPDDLIVVPARLINF
jgi:polysaccharide export outer membrane protein